MYYSINNLARTLLFVIGFNLTIIGSPIQTTAVQVTHSNQNEIYLDFYSPQLHYERVTQSEFGIGDKISVQSENRSYPDHGNPHVPIIQSFVYIPDKGSVTLSIENYTAEEIGSFDIVPYQREVHSPYSKSSHYGINRSIYTSNKFFPPSFVMLKSCEIWRDIRIARIHIYPVLYNPVTKKCIHIKSARLKITINHSQQGHSELSLQDRKITNYSLVLYKDVLNIDSYLNSKPISNELGSYVFLGNNKNLEAVRDLILWKKQKGYRVHEAVVGSDSIKQTSESIDSWLENAYKTWPHKPEYILLVGNKDAIPPKMLKDPLYNSFHPADPYFGCIGEAQVPSMHVGRITGNKFSNVDDPTVLKYIAWKIIQHEKNPTNGDWRSLNLAWAAYAGGVGKSIQSKWTALTEKGFRVIRGTDENAGTNEKIMDCKAYTQSFNSGSSLATYVGHGLSDQWHTLKFTNNTIINDVNNEGKLPFVMSCSCLGGDYVETYCLYENFLCEGSIDKPKGAVNAFGFACRASVTQDGIILKALKHMFEDQIWRIGPATSLAKNKAPFNTDAFCSMVFGCPESEFYTTSSLKALQISYTIQGKKITAHITENNKNVKGAIVSVVTKKYERLTSGFTGDDGKFSGSIGSIHYSDSLILTITNHNSKPYIKMISSHETKLMNPSQSIHSGFACNNILYSHVNKKLNIMVQVPQSGKLTAKLFDIHGRTMNLKNYTMNKSGTYQIVMNTLSKTLAQGYYILSLQFKNHTILRPTTIL